MRRGRSVAVCAAFIRNHDAFDRLTLELVSKELNHFGVIADLFRQTVVDLCYFALFEDFSL